jgi:hypothetical protein
MATSEQAITAQTGAQQSEEPQERNKGYRRRILRLVEETFGPSPHAQIQGLLALRGGKQVTKHVDEELRAAYARGRADLQAEIVFAERLAAIQNKYPDFNHAWAQVRPLVPRPIWEEVANLEHGLEAAYHLSKLPEMARELSELEPEKARERFRHFVKDLAALGGL